MLSDPIQSTQDLRSRAVDRKRDKQEKAKWSKSWYSRCGYPTGKPGPDDEIKRPIRLHPKGYPAYKHKLNDKYVHDKQLYSKQDVWNVKPEDRESEGSSSSASEPDQDELNVRDHADGLDRRGENVLAMALDKAITKFEDKQTTMLIKNEYEVLDDSDIEKDDSGELANEDDDYELV